MNDPEILAQHSGPLRTRIGAAFPGKRAVFRGCDLHRDLKDASWLDLYIFGITGRRLTAEQLKLLDAIWAYTSYPDARLWNNRIAALAGASRSTAALAVAGAMAVSEAAIYGGQTIMGSAGFFESTQAALTQGKSLQAVVEDYLHVNRGIPGYGRPIRRMDADERIAPILKLADSLGLGCGRYVALAQHVESILASGRWRMRMNYGAITAALTLDLGFTSQDHYVFTLPAFLAGMPPCYVDALARPEGATFPIACNQINYCGPKGKSWQDT